MHFFGSGKIFRSGATGRNFWPRSFTNYLKRIVGTPHGSAGLGKNAKKNQKKCRTERTTRPSCYPCLGSGLCVYVILTPWQIAGQRYSHHQYLQPRLFLLAGVYKKQASAKCRCWHLQPQTPAPTTFENCIISSVI